MNPWPPHVYRLADGAQDVPEDILGNAVDQAHRVQLGLHALPAILTLNHLACQTEVPYPLLRGVVKREEPGFYRTFPMRKRSGGRRLICIPSPLLLKAQKWLARFVLGAVPAHPASFAYAKRSSILQCARMH